MIRGSPAEVILPKVFVLLRFEPGGFRWTLLNKLKKSALS